MITVLNPGMYTSVQDGGRFGYRKMGVPVGGAMDSHAAAMGNDILGKDVGEAVIEFTSPGPEFLFEANMRIVLTGADMKARLNGRMVALEEPIEIKAGSKLKFTGSGSMMWGYMAIDGRLDDKMTLGSHSQTPGVTTKFRLEAGDTLIFNGEENRSVYSGGMDTAPIDYSSEALVVTKGPDYHKLPEAIKSKITESVFELSKDCNRMAYVLEGNLKPGADEIITAPVQPGTIQMTSSGKLVILMRDAQTTGGYSRVLQLSDESRNILAQRRPGQSVVFKLSD